MVYQVPPMVTVTTKQVVQLDYTDVKARVSAYTVSYEDCGKIDGITASGKSVSRGMIAAPKHLPFGTEVTIKGKRFVVEDRGGAIVVQDNGTYNIDYYVPTRAEAMEFGIQKLTIRIHGMKSTTTKIIKTQEVDKEWIRKKQIELATQNIKKWVPQLQETKSQMKLEKPQQKQTKLKQPMKLMTWQKLLPYKLRCIMTSCAIVVYLRKMH